METKSTNEVKGDYDRVSASECLGSLIELHGIVMEDDLFVIPDADGTAVLYNDGKIRFDEIADIEVGSVFVGILLCFVFGITLRVFVPGNFVSFADSPGQFSSTCSSRPWRWPCPGWR